MPKELISSGDAKDGAAVVTSAIASGGLVGAGLAILALQLPPHWQPIGLAIVPTLSSTLALGVKTIAGIIRKRYSMRQWEADKQTLIEYADVSISVSSKAFETIQDEKAREILQGGISRLQRLKALALGALPHERPWLSELQNLAAAASQKHALSETGS